MTGTGVIYVTDAGRLSAYPSTMRLEVLSGDALATGEDAHGPVGEPDPCACLTWEEHLSGCRGVVS